MSEVDGAGVAGRVRNRPADSTARAKKMTAPTAPTACRPVVKATRAASTSGPPAATADVRPSRAAAVAEDGRDAR